MAQQDKAVLAKLFKAEAKAKLKQNAKQTVQDAGGSPDLANFFDGLSDQEIETLFKTWNEMDRMGVKGTVDGATASFL
jgi:hypothetical protein